MLNPQDKKEIQQLIQKELADFKNKNMSFRSKRIGDTPTDKNQLSPSSAIDGLLQSYFKLTGATLVDGANINVGTGTGTQIATTTSQKLGFWGATPVGRQNITGSRGGNAALASLLTALATEGLITDSTTA